jgi:hypothetical protein
LNLLLSCQDHHSIIKATLKGIITVKKIMPELFLRYRVTTRRNEKTICDKIYAINKERKYFMKDFRNFILTII